AAAWARASGTGTTMWLPSRASLTSTTTTPVAATEPAAMAGTATAPIRTIFSMSVPLVDPDADGRLVVPAAHGVAAAVPELGEGGAHVELVALPGEEGVHHRHRHLDAHLVVPVGLVHVDEDEVPRPRDLDRLVLFLDGDELAVAGGLELGPGLA